MDDDIFQSKWFLALNHNRRRRFKRAVMARRAAEARKQREAERQARRDAQIAFLVRAWSVARAVAFGLLLIGALYIGIHATIMLFLR